MVRRLKILLMSVYLIVGFSDNVFSQNEGELFTTVIFLKEQHIREIEINNIKYDLYIKEKGGKEYIPVLDGNSGTGFFVQDSRGIYLVTAEHIAIKMIYNVKVTVHGKGDVPLTYDLSQLTGNVDKQKWVYHKEADVAVLKLKPIIDLREHVKTIPIEAFIADNVTFDKNRPLTTIGFPLELGLQGKFSPIIKTSKAGSGKFRYKRFDNNKESDFFILEDTTVAGFSGAPVCAFPDVKFGGVSLGVGSFMCVGLVHGTFSDNTGGKFAAIVPLSYIIETIKQIINAPN